MGFFRTLVPAGLLALLLAGPSGAADLERGRFLHGTFCLGCHDPHTNANEMPGLLSTDYLAAAKGSVVVRPHYRKGLCFACHENLDDYALRLEDLNALCDRCHASGRIAANIHLFGS